MDARQVGPSKSEICSLHPLLSMAAIAITLFSLAGIGALTGWLPGPGTPGKTPARAASAFRVAPMITVAPAPTFGAPRTMPTIAVASLEAENPDTPHRAQVCRECGVVEEVREIAIAPEAGATGAIAGGLIGGLLGNQVSKGTGRTVATVLGAVGGAWAGSYLEQTLRTRKRYETVVRFDDDSTRSFGSETPPDWQRGDRVRLQNGLLTMGGGKSKCKPELI